MSRIERFDLSGKVSLVTGAGSGLGRVFCEGMAENGACNCRGGYAMVQRRGVRPKN